MRQLSKARCVAMQSCPGVVDPEDGSGELIVTGHDERGVEVPVRIARELVEQAVTELQSRSSQGATA